MERKLTTRFINFTSERALASWGFCSMFANSVTNADTGKYKINLEGNVSIQNASRVVKGRHLPDAREIPLRDVLD